MNKRIFFGLATATAMAIVAACGGNSKTALTPSQTSAGAAAPADGSTLKAEAPTLAAPAEGVRTDTKTPQLVANNATAKFVTAVTLSYRFQVVDANGVVVDDAVEADGAGGSAGKTAHTVSAAANLGFDATYRWRVRTENDSAFGPWSAYASFLTPEAPKAPSAVTSYQTATELWDVLTDGKTIGVATGMEFVTGKGARTIGNESNIRYQLLQTLTEGEFSFYVDNLNPLSTGDKTKLMSMMEGDGDITTNDYRFTVEKRGASYTQPGQVRMRIITGEESRIFDSAPTVPPLQKARTYFVKLTWGGGRARLQIIEADATTGVLGRTVHDGDMGYGSHAYGPVPHVAYIGAPVGRAGSQDASVSNMTVRGVFIAGSGTSRPGSTFQPFDFSFGFDRPGS
jgi:hypothetical protein